jgi:hypothetical protein
MDIILLLYHFLRGFLISNPRLIIPPPARCGSSEATEVVKRSADGVFGRNRSFGSDLLRQLEYLNLQSLDLLEELEAIAIKEIAQQKDRTEHEPETGEDAEVEPFFATSISSNDQEDRAQEDEEYPHRRADPALSLQDSLFLFNHLVYLRSVFFKAVGSRCALGQQPLSQAFIHSFHDRSSPAAL